MYISAGRYGDQIFDFTASFTKLHLFSTMGAFTATHGGGQASTDLTTLLAGRNVKWYRGHYARLNLICVGQRLDVRMQD
jgi:hypothetical protein